MLAGDSKLAATLLHARELLYGSMAPMEQFAGRLV